MCALSLELQALSSGENEPQKWFDFKYTDLDLLMYMTVRNLERENNKMWETCRFALRSAKAQIVSESGDEEKAGLTKLEKVSNDYYRKFFL